MNTLIKKTTIFALSFLIIGCSLKAQQRLSVDSIFKALSDSFPQENVYLHTDKDKYMAGDTLWFKSYLFSGGFPGGTSTGLHVELFSPEGNLVQRKYYPLLKGGISLGEMECKDSLPQGLYTIRAYTDWMSNFDPAFFYKYTFPLYGVKTAAPAKGKAGRHAASPDPGAQGNTPAGQASAGAVAVQFLPEGGDAITNVTTSVAFRATNEKGLPVAVSGKVVDDLDTLVTTFQTVHDGMGSFDYTPWKGRTYTAVAETPYGERRIPLPAPRADGVTLNAKLTNKGVQFFLRSDSVSRYLNQPLTVVASMYGQLAFKAKTRLSADMPEISGFIPTDKFVSGILTITLFGQDEEPLAERLVFIRPTDFRITAALSLDTLSMTAKGFNAWNLHLPDSAATNLSVSITDADAYVPGEDRPTILSGLLLEGDLKGHIHHPDWYFRDDADSTQAALDLVMLTHGWRRFDWAMMARGRFPSIQRTDKNYLSFEGQAFTESGKKLLKNTSLIAFLKGSDSTKKLIMVPVDSAGDFSVDGLIFFDTATAYFQVNKKGYAGKNVQLKLKPFPNFPLTAEDLSGIVFPPSTEDSAFVGTGNREAELLAGLRRLQKAKELKEIIITGRKKSPLQEMDERYASGLFSGGDSHSFDLVNDNKDAMAYMDILSFLQGRVAGLMISGTFPNVSVRYRGGKPSFFVDEMPAQLDMLENIPVPDIAYVKVFMPPFVGAIGGGANGAIAIYTRRGNDETATIDGLNRLTLDGYSNFRQFYAPVYDSKDTSSMGRPDYRITLDWKPYLFSGGGRQTIPIRFYNNDECRHYRLVAEGVDENGKLLHFEQVIGAEDSGRTRK
jgi:hypothetical protein